MLVGQVGAIFLSAALGSLNLQFSVRTSDLSMQYVAGESLRLFSTPKGVDKDLCSPSASPILLQAESRANMPNPGPKEVKSGSVDGVMFKWRPVGSSQKLAANQLNFQLQAYTMFLERLPSRLHQILNSSLSGLFWMRMYIGGPLTSLFGQSSFHSRPKANRQASRGASQKRCQ
eukprot:2289960-Amphidinium_carterae.1